MVTYSRRGIISAVVGTVPTLNIVSESQPDATASVSGGRIAAESHSITTSCACAADGVSIAKQTNKR